MAECLPLKISTANTEGFQRNPVTTVIMLALELRSLDWDQNTAVLQTQK